MSVTHDEYRRARYIVEPAAEVLLDIVRPDKRGRPTLHPRILLTGMFLSIQKYGTATISSTFAVLTIDLPRELQWDLGVLTGPAHAPKPIAEHHLYKLSRRINPHLDHSRKRAFGHARAVRLQRRARLDALSTLILARTLLPRPAGSVDYALDGTGFDASERGVKKPAAVKELETHEESLSAAALAELKASDLARSRAEQADPALHVGRGAKGPTDADWGKRTGKFGGRETYWGYDVEAMIAVPRIGEKGPRRDEPSMVVRLVAIPASTDIVGPCLRMIDSMLADGIRVGELLVDRHYSYKAYDRWGSELLRRGIHQIADLRECDHGFRDWDGMQIAASWPHCPATPSDLGVIERPGPGASAEAKAAFAERIEQRQPFATQFVNRPNTQGWCKVRCPAKNGTVGCPLVAGTVAAAAIHNLPTVSDPPAAIDRPKICTQATVTLRMTTPAQQRAMKLHQPDYWGSPAWEKNYARRTRIEGWFGVLKSASSTGMDRDSYQFRGLPWVTLVLSLAAAVTNHHLLRSWHESSGLGDPDHPLLRPDQPFHGFTQLSAEQAREIDKACARQYAAGPSTSVEDEPGRRAS